ncbi:MAG: hypothetical protein M1840_000782 [Geoglossum simile]|nr:MAG: hypothetical protein M1840_000782 [Geoglossum simile]
MSFPAATSEGSSLLSRLSTLLPALEAANAELERDRAAGTLKDRQIDNVDENADGGYIEMDLGLGVLEERNLDDTTTCGGTSEETLSSESDDDNVDIRNNQFGKSSSSERNILGRLMGQKKRNIGRSKAKPMILEVGGN